MHLSARVHHEKGPIGPIGLYDASTGREWPQEAVNRFVVGRIYGNYDNAQTSLHLGLAYKGFTNVTSTELERFWTFISCNTTLLHLWGHKTSKDPEVKKVLDDIKTVVDEARMNSPTLKAISEVKGEVEMVDA